MTRVINYNNNPRRNLKLYWKQFYPDWEIPKGYHVHHIKPKCTFVDPCDPKIHHPSNLIALHPDDHYTIHKCRGDTYISKKFVTSILGRIMTEEAKQHLSNLNKGKPSPLIGRKGHVVSEQTKQKLREINLGKKYGKRDPSVGKKISAKLKGKPKSEEHCKNMSISSKGQIPWNKGLKGRILTKTKCPHCLRFFDPGNYKQHHGDKCKMAGVSK